MYAYDRHYDDAYPPPRTPYAPPGLVKVDVRNGLLNALENEPQGSSLRSLLQVNLFETRNHWGTPERLEDWKILFQIIRGGPKPEDLGVLEHFMEKYPHR